MLKQRFVEILIDGEWQIRTFAAVKKGMVFKIYEPNGTLLSTPDGSGELIAVKDSTIKNGLYTVEYKHKNKLKRNKK